MKSRQNILMALVAGLALLAAGAAGGWWWATRHDTAVIARGGGPAPIPQNDRKVLYWYDPMYPQHRFDQPGKSPFMDMALVPKYADSDQAQQGVRIDPRMTQNLGLRQAVVERIRLTTAVEAPGILGFNERDVVIEQARANGFVERAWPLAPGDVIVAGQPLVELLVPEWTAAQNEYLVVRDYGDMALVAAARDRLRLLGMTAEQIGEIERTRQPRSRFVVHSTRGGVVQALEVRPGMTVTAGQTLARIHGLSTVWLETAVPEALAGGLRAGSRAEVRMAAFPERTLAGRVTAILPVLADASRSLRVRVELPNSEGMLRPGMSAQVKFLAEATESALAVPTEAVIRTGQRSVVMVAEDQGRFIPVEVTLGREIGNRTVIASGLREGQRIVTSGQFLIDSEASLSGMLASAGTMAPDSDTTGDAIHEADARVEAIDDHTISLAHGPFKSLAMPGMTMAFPIDTPDLIKGIQIGDQVRVGVRQTDRGLAIVRIEKKGDQP